MTASISNSQLHNSQCENMVALIEGAERSLDAARRALQWAADEGPDVGGVPVVIHDPGGNQGTATE